MQTGTRGSVRVRLDSFRFKIVYNNVHLSCAHERSRYACEHKYDILYTRVEHSPTKILPSGDV